MDKEIASHEFYKQTKKSGNSFRPTIFCANPNSDSVFIFLRILIISPKKIKISTSRYPISQNPEPYVYAPLLIQIF